MTYQEARDRIGARVMELRLEEGLTQEELALKAGLKENNIRAIENARYAVTIDVLEHIAEALGRHVSII